MHCIRINHSVDEFNISMRKWIFWILTDVSLNTNSPFHATIANQFCNELNDLSDDLTLDGIHANYMYRLQKWLLTLRPSHFKKIEKDGNNTIDIIAWWKFIEELIKTICLSGKNPFTCQI